MRSTSTRSDAESTSAVTRIATTTTDVIATTAMPSMRPMRATSAWSGVRCSSVVPRRRAMFPISVAMPVAVTTARPRPRVTAVPSNTMFNLSPSAAGAPSLSVSFATTMLSPVSAASATVSDATSTRRASALTASPSSSSTRSPGTRSAAGIRCARPSRTTPAVAAAMRWSAATACSARASWTKPSRLLRTTITAITIASYGTPSAPSANQATTEIAAAASRR